MSRLRGGSIIAAVVVTSAERGTITEAECAAAMRYSEERKGLALLVLVDGAPVCHSGERSLDVPHELWSGTKSFVGLIAAAAVQDGLLTLDEKIADTLPEWRADERKRSVTIRHLLSMTSGQVSEIGRPPGYRDAAQAPPQLEPGTAFRYGPTPLQAFGEVFTAKLRARGLDASPLAYLERRLLKPAGISYARWRNGPDGQPLLPQGAVLSARQWAQFGEFVRQGAMVDGKRIVDAKAFEELFVGSEANPAYGLTWWLPRSTGSDDAITAQFDLAHHPQAVPTDTVIAAGAGEQRLYIIPSLGITVVRQGKLELANG
jgi:CubicO group peptidase (beta-lactamase class C family)